MLQIWVHLAERCSYIHHQLLLQAKVTPHCINLFSRGYFTKHGFCNHLRCNRLPPLSSFFYHVKYTLTSIIFICKLLLYTSSIISVSRHHCLKLTHIQRAHWQRMLSFLCYCSHNLYVLKPKIKPILCMCSLCTAAQISHTQKPSKNAASTIFLIHSFYQKKCHGCASPVTLFCSCFLCGAWNWPPSSETLASSNFPRQRASFSFAMWYTSECVSFLRNTMEPL